MFALFLSLSMLLLGTTAQKYTRFTSDKEFYVDKITTAPSHADARKICQERGGDLVIIKSRAEYNFVVNLTLHSGFSTSKLLV